MGFIGLLLPWGVILQALAIVHFIRRRPDGIWLWIIVFLGPLGALVYIAMEVVPDLALLRGSLESTPPPLSISKLFDVLRDVPELRHLPRRAGTHGRSA
jgi:hypothetical protein